MAGLTAVLIAGGVTITAYALIRHDHGYARPYGIPAAVPDSQVNLMGLSSVPVRPAPGFTLTDQDDGVLSLSAFHGQVVVLEFLDPHCTDICPTVSDEFTDAYPSGRERYLASPQADHSAAGASYRQLLLLARWGRIGRGPRRAPARRRRPS